MLYYSGKSDIAHFDGCGYIGRIKEDNLHCLSTYAAVRDRSMNLCRCCNPIRKAFKDENCAIADFCSKNMMIFSNESETISFKTSNSQWRVIPSDDGGLALYHRNKKKTRKNSKSPLWGYHLQKFKSETIVPVCKYIAEHEEYKRLQAFKSAEGIRRSMPKGGKKRRAYEKREKRRERRAAIKNVYFLFDMIEAGNAVR